MLIYALTIFASAFLLFQVQPLIAKQILPWFGGGPAVWTSCMLFFQVLLLGGYTYAHLVRTKLRQRTQVVVHLAVLAAALLLLPIAPSARWKPLGGEDPTWRILVLLAVSVGLPYFVLSTTGPLLQAWFSRTFPGRSPYRLYSLSNVGSLLALLSYPFAVEPSLALRTQDTAWSVGFALFALLCCLCAMRTWNLRAEDAAAEEVPGADPEPPPGLGVRLLWLALPATGSIMLLAVTNQMCWDVAIVPFLWVLPLSLYLLSFILCFLGDGWHIKRIVLWVPLAGSVVGVVWLMFKGIDVSIEGQVLGYSGALFVACMVCHGELVRLKPRPRYLTSFYLMVSAGGAAGGIFVSLIAPHVFPMYLELHIGLWLTVALAMVAFLADKRSWAYFRLLRARYPLRRVPGPVGEPEAPRPRGARLLLGRLWAHGGMPVLLLLMVGSLGTLEHCLRKEANDTLLGSVSLSRNFYGVLRVVSDYQYEIGSDDSKRWLYYKLQHGRINHGCQFAAKERRRDPNTYYGEKSGIGLALLHLPRESGLRVGVIGLGTGTIAVYGQEGDTYRFYEINPAVKRLATSRFTYLADTPAKCEIILGDARLSLERELKRRESQQFDVLAIDAFTSDAIPAHLLTREAFEQVYLRHMKPGGVIAVHISNRYLDLAPVVQGLADSFGLAAALIASESDNDRRIYACTWVLVTRNMEFLLSDPLREAIEKSKDEAPTTTCLWTDDYSDLFRILK